MYFRVSKWKIKRDRKKREKSKVLNQKHGRSLNRNPARRERERERKRQREKQGKLSFDVDINPLLRRRLQSVARESEIKLLKVNRTREKIEIEW